MKSVVNTKKEFRKVLISVGVVFCLLFAIAALVHASKYFTQNVLNRPAPAKPSAYEMLPLDRVQVGKFAASLGFTASPDEVLGVGDESIYRWGKRSESSQFLEVSFREGYVDYEARPIVGAVEAGREVSEIKVANWLAWDFLQKATLWDSRIELVPEIKLFNRDKGGVESAVGSFKEANYFKAYFEGRLRGLGTLASTSDDKALILAPDFETFLARVEIMGQSGQVLKARIYPVFIGKEMEAAKITPTREEVENLFRPEGGFLPEGRIVYIARKNDYLTLWLSQAATTKQVFEAITVRANERSE